MAAPAVSPPQTTVERRGTPFNSNDFRVFAAIDGNVASNLLNLQGVGVAQGLTDKGYIYTDRRPIAGQLVNIRGCLRRAANDAYVIDKDKPYTVEVFDARNRPIRQEKVKLDAFGSFHAHFVLPPDSPQGEYRVLVHDLGAQNFQGTFLVHEYQLEPIRLVVDTPRRVYYRGEPIEGTIRAEFYYGAPVVGREIRYQLSGDRFETATTDAKGEIKIELAYPRVQRIAGPAARGANARRQRQHPGQFRPGRPGLLHRREHGAAGLRDRRVAGGDRQRPRRREQAAGPEAHAQGAGADAGRRPARRAAGRGARLTTAADGKARQTIKLDKGGTYFLRAEAIDRFHNPISGQAAVQISGEDDLVRLRILADKHTYKVGDTAAVQLHWREAPAPGAGDIPGRAGAGLSPRRVEDRGQQAGDSHDGAACAEFRAGRGGDDGPRSEGAGSRRGGDAGMQASRSRHSEHRASVPVANSAEAHSRQGSVPSSVSIPRQVRLPSSGTCA